MPSVFSPLWAYGVPPELLDEIEQAPSVERLAELANNFLAAIGLGKATYHLVRKAGIGDCLPSFVTNYPTEWIRRYEHQGYLKVDPVMLRARNSVVPFAWSDTVTHGLNRTQIRFFAEAVSFGLLDGYTVPIHFPGGFAIFTACAEGSAEERRESVALGAQAVTCWPWRSMPGPKC